MSTIEQQLRTALLADAGVHAKISDRLYLVQIPQNPTLPAVAYQRISTTRLYAHAIGTPQASLGHARFQFTIFAGTKSGGLGALEVSAAIKAALQTFNLAQEAQSPNVVRQAPNFVLNEFMRIEPDINPQPVFVVVLDVRVWFQELT